MIAAARRLSRLALAALALSALAPAGAQDYPARPIRFVVAFPAGSGIDTMSRVLIDEIRKVTSATIVVEYKPGALGQIGTEFTARAPADGYTVMASSSATHSSGAQLAKSVPYDAVRDFTHVGRLARFHVFLVTNPQQGFRTVADLVAEARRAPGRISYGYGSGTARVVAAAFARSAGIEVLAVPYKGQPPALTDLMGGQIHFVTADLAVIQPHVKSGRLTALAIASERRSALLPGVPTLGEQGIRDVELSGWVGVSGPAGMPRDAVAWWNAQMNRALGSKEFIERLHALSLESEPSSVEEFNQLVRTQFQVWGQRIREAGIPLE
ncbi:MAG: tripartite tricarboxylate transporter substrate binding protein [Burkholderiales bacterium]|nr:tripartite tricarboxylate transporter substrate binding protein [Burkholderiales bacterium]